jgi:hypothetical protein
MADRGYHPPEASLRLSEQAVKGIIRLNPWAMPLYRRTGERLDWAEPLKQA